MLVEWQLGGDYSIAALVEWQLGGDDTVFQCWLNGNWEGMTQYSSAG